MARTLSLILVFLFSSPFAFALALDSHWKERYDRFHNERVKITRADYSLEETNKAISFAFKNFTDGRATDWSRQVSTQELGYLFLAADEVAFYTSSLEHALEMLEIGREMRIRNSLSDFNRDQIYLALTAARDFHLAKKWKAEAGSSLSNSILDVIDETNEKKGEPTILMIADDSRIVTRKPLALGKGEYVLALVHPSCHFSSNAIHEIASDAKLGAIKSKLILLSPQHRDQDLSVFQKWNRNNPDLRIQLMYSFKEWPYVDANETPIFNFIRDGKVITKVAGWPAEGHQRALLEAAKLSFK